MQSPGRIIDAYDTRPKLMAAQSDRCHYVVRNNRRTLSFERREEVRITAPKVSQAWEAPEHDGETYFDDIRLRSSADSTMWYKVKPLTVLILESLLAHLGNRCRIWKATSGLKLVGAAEAKLFKWEKSAVKTR